MSSKAVVGQLAVDECLHALLDVRLELRGLILRDPPVGERLVDPLLVGSDERLNETGRRLALLFGDLRERLVLERRAELLLAEAEVRRSRVEYLEVTLVPESRPESAPTQTAQTEERGKVARVEPLLELGTLLLREPAGSHRVVDPVLEGPPERIGQRLWLHPELGRRVVDDGLALVAGRQDVRRRDGTRSAEADDQ